MHNLICIASARVIASIDQFDLVLLVLIEYSRIIGGLYTKMLMDKQRSKLSYCC